MAAVRETCLVVTFASTHDAMAAERSLLEQGVAGRIIPTPVAISSECGLAWKSPVAAREALLAALAALAHDAVVEMEL